jgi:hypothetical protein
LPASSPRPDPVVCRPRRPRCDRIWRCSALRCPPRRRRCPPRARIRRCVDLAVLLAIGSSGVPCVAVHSAVAGVLLALGSVGARTSPSSCDRIRRCPPPSLVPSPRSDPVVRGPRRPPRDRILRCPALRCTLPSPVSSPRSDPAVRGPRRPPATGSGSALTLAPSRGDLPRAPTRAGSLLPTATSPELFPAPAASSPRRYPPSSSPRRRPPRPTPPPSSSPRRRPP